MRDRYVTEDNIRYAARMQKDGTDYICQLRIDLNICYSRDDEGFFKNTDGYPCQYLRIRDGCTVIFVEYELGTPVPPSALVGGYSAEGLPVYIGRGFMTDSSYSRYGYYIPGSNSLVDRKHNFTENVGLLVSL